MHRGRVGGRSFDVEQSVGADEILTQAVGVDYPIQIFRKQWSCSRIQRLHAVHSKSAAWLKIVSVPTKEPGTSGEKGSQAFRRMMAAMLELKEKD